jgi:hypothetical protein
MNRLDRVTRILQQDLLCRDTFDRKNKTQKDDQYEYSQGICSPPHLQEQ